MEDRTPAVEEEAQRQAAMEEEIGALAGQSLAVGLSDHIIGPLLAGENAALAVSRRGGEAVLSVEPADGAGGTAGAEDGGSAPLVGQITELVEFLAAEVGHSGGQDGAKGAAGGGRTLLLRWLVRCLRLLEDSSCCCHHPLTDVPHLGSWTTQGRQLWPQIERGIVARLGPVEPEPTVAAAEQASKLAGFESKLRVWLDEKTAQFDAGGAAAQKQSAKYGSRGGYVAWLEQSVAEKLNSARTKAAIDPAVLAADQAERQRRQRWVDILEAGGALFPCRASSSRSCCV